MRHIKIVKQLALGVALAGIWSPQVWAQEADAAEAESGGGAEIIVTARRVEEKLQDVPMTVNVVTDQKLKDLNLFNGSDLVNVAPGLTFAPSFRVTRQGLLCAEPPRATPQGVRTPPFRLT